MYHEGECGGTTEGDESKVSPARTDGAFSRDPWADQILGDWSYLGSGALLSLVVMCFPPEGRDGLMKTAPGASRAADSWNVEYMHGRYTGEEPVPFVTDILSASRHRGISRGLYLGCGNGRNFVPLVEAGLDLTGVDLPSVAIRQLSARLPTAAKRLHVGGLTVLPRGATYPLVIGIQVFQHGDRAACHMNIRTAQHVLDLSGLFCLRVNAIGSEYEYRNEVTETHEDGSETIRYLDGPKAGLTIHFFGRGELDRLFKSDFLEVLPLRRVVMHRDPPRVGHWDQWEAIWQKR